MKVAKHTIRVEHPTRKITYSSSNVPKIVHIQACWRRAIQVRRFKRNIKFLRKEREEEFERERQKLKLLYPMRKSVDYFVVLKRIKKFDLLRILVRETEKTMIVQK